MPQGQAFVAQAFSGDIKTLTELIQAAMEHEGFALVNVFSPCVTYNKVNTYEYFKEKLTSVSDIEGYDPTNKGLAYQTVMEYDGLLQGIIYQQERPAYHTFLKGYPETPIAFNAVESDKAVLDELWAAFK